MRKILISCIVFVLLLTGCASGNVVNIREKMFATQVSEIYANSKDYRGKTLKLEGMYSDKGAFQEVYRTTNGCCGTDGWAGFRIVWDGAKPNENDWVEVQGTFEPHESNGEKYLAIKATELKVLTKRGAEFVTQ